MSYRSAARGYTVVSWSAGIVFFVVAGVVTVLCATIVPVLGLLLGPWIGVVAGLLVVAPLLILISSYKRRRREAFQASVDQGLCAWCDAHGVRHHQGRGCWRCDRCNSAYKHDGTRFVPKLDW